MKQQKATGCNWMHQETTGCNWMQQGRSRTAGRSDETAACNAHQPETPLRTPGSNRKNRGNSELPKTTEKKNSSNSMQPEKPQGATRKTRLGRLASNSPCNSPSTGSNKLLVNQLKNSCSAGRKQRPSGLKARRRPHKVDRRTALPQTALLALPAWSTGKSR